MSALPTHEAKTTSHPKYELFDPIHIGQSNTVYAAHDMELDRAVAIKDLRPDATDQQRELLFEEAAFLRDNAGDKIVGCSARAGLVR